MRVDVIRPVLRIVLEHEHHGALPERALRQSLDNSSQRSVIVRHVGPRCWLAGLSTRRMVVRKREYLERRQLSRSHEFLKLLEPNLGACLIGNVQVPSRIRGICVADQGAFCCRGGYGRASPRWFVRFVDELTVIPVSNPCTLGEIPQVPAGWLGHIVIGHATTIESLVIVAPPPPGVVARYRLLGVVSHIARHRPVVSIGTDFGVYEEAIEDAEPLRESVMVWRDAARKEDERRIPVRLTEIAENLIVGSVLLDDVDHVLERRILFLLLSDVPSIRCSNPIGKP